MVKWLIVYCLFFVSQLATAQLWPPEGRIVNYRLVGFSAPEPCNGCVQQIEIATGHFDVEDSFSHHVILSRMLQAGKAIVEVPGFGTEYTWRILRSNEAGNNLSGPLHHFKTGTNLVTDTAGLRLRVVKNSTTLAETYFFLDGNKGLYDKDGRLIWYLPVIDGIDYGTVTDLKLSPTGTITLMYNDKKAFEINYNGDILWSAPNNDNPNPDLHYHHELTKLNNGNYMVLATEIGYVCPRKSSSPNSAQFNFSYEGKIRTDDVGLPVAFPFATLNEYSKSGTLVWQWKFADYFQHSDLMYGWPTELKKTYDSHPNSFYFDEAGKHIYISMRNISRVLKIDYPTKKVVATYGQVYKKGVNVPDSGMFSGQHSVGLSAAGYLSLFNNNVAHPDQEPYGAFFKEKAGNLLENVWSYNCKETVPSNEARIAYNFTRGGNILTLPNDNRFIANCNPACNLFIVDKDKNLIWSAQPEAWSVFDKKWVVSPQYKPSLINGKTELEKMIWNTEQALH